MLTFDAPTHQYFWKGAPVPSVTSIIRSALGNPFEQVAADVMERAQQRGKAVHYACELDDEGKLDDASVDPRIAPYLDAWRLFRQQFKFRVLFAEKALYSETYGYAGTPDCAIEFEGGPRAVLDRKTGLPGMAAGLQTAAYAHLVELELASIYPQRRFALRMMPSGKYKMDEYKSPGDFRNFLACLAVHRMKESLQ